MHSTGRGKLTSGEHLVVSSLHPQWPLLSLPTVLARVHTDIDGPRNGYQVRPRSGGELGRKTAFGKQTVPQRHLRRASARFLVSLGSCILGRRRRRGKREIEVLDDLIRDPATVGGAQWGERFDLLGVSR